MLLIVRFWVDIFPPCVSRVDVNPPVSSFYKQVFKINLNDSMLYFGLYVQLRRGSVAGYTTDECWAYGPKEGVEAFESITFFIRFIYAINFEHLLIFFQFYLFGVKLNKLSKRSLAHGAEIGRLV